jgi:hypothetical protein
LSNDRRWNSYGEALLERELEVEKRDGIEHYVQGQAKAQVLDEEDGVLGALYGFCDQMGGAVLMVLFKEPGGQWEAEIAHRSGYFTPPGRMPIPECFEPNEEMLKRLDAAEKEWRETSG